MTAASKDMQLVLCALVPAGSLRRLALPDTLSHPWHVPCRRICA